jgi:thymidylate synthase (FAD)
MQSAEIEVQYKDHMGTDKTVVNAARVSFSKDDLEPFNSKDEKLIAYLAKHNHWSPFAHTSIQLKIKAPIFVARQLVKHTVGQVWNEVSRRYVDFEPEFWIPTELRGRPVNAKQGSSGTIDRSHIEEIANSYAASLASYQRLLAAGVAPEQARMVLPLGCMTDWYWTGSLVFWARVCQLRLDAHAQEETAAVARQISPIVGQLFPVSWAALLPTT